MTPFEPIARDDELEEIAAFLDDDQARSSVLLLDGEPGIGKTTLWRRGIVEAKKRGYRILSCSPSEAEAELAYAALSDLAEEALPEVEDTLPPPQLRARTHVSR